MSSLEAVFICSPRRTAIGSFGGALSNTPAPRLGAHAIGAVLGDTGVKPDSIDEVIMGCVLTAGVGQAPARQAAIFAGLPPTVQAMTVNKVCSSGLKAVMLAADAIRLGRAQAVIAGGMENMSLAPYLMPQLRNGARLGHATAEDSIIRDGLWDVYNDFHMGSAAELCAREFKLSREEQDKYAIESYTRANRAIKEGAFAAEIAPITVKQGREESTVDTDEEPGRGRPDKIPTLKPVFQKDGTVTAANASSINDGAAAMLVCPESYAERNGLKPVARVVAQGWSGQAPEWFTTAPVDAARKALAAANVSVESIDLFEINEAFSAVALACGKSLEIDPAKLNINGGAVALGHPIGCSGARILTTLIHSLLRHKKKLGLAAICNGGGEATAMIVEHI